MRITKVYTRAGDKGETSLVGGKRVSKASARVEAYGDVDELNSLIGIARTEIDEADANDALRAIQNELFTAGADLASPMGVAVPRIESQWVQRLEEVIDRFNEQMPPLEEFILPAGTPGAAALHLARAVCRRAERRIVALAHEEEINESVLAYINRLSDLLFVLARVVNRRAGAVEQRVVFPRREPPPG
jgi:cob(I)alamin adenosyltransferase